MDINVFLHYTHISEYCGDVVLFSLLLSGANPSVSGTAFKAWLFCELCVGTPLNTSVN